MRDNILFGKEYDEQWYNTVIEACALQRDLEMLPDGDQTEIGERGITVSGGQKARLNLARAIYFNADIVLLDDPLSAVDAHVGKHLFDQAISGLLKGKCRILATHQLHVLDRVDRVIWMEGGRIEAIGTFQELMQGNPGFAEMMREIATDANDEEEPEEGDEIEESDDKPKQKKRTGQGKQLMQAEDRAIKTVPWKVYKAYIRGSGSLLVAPAIILMLVASQAANIMSSLWLSDWISDKYGLTKGTYVSHRARAGKLEASNKLQIGIFAALGVIQSVFMFVFAFSLTIAGTQSSKVLMGKAMRQTLRAPMYAIATAFCTSAVIVANPRQVILRYHSHGPYYQSIFEGRGCHGQSDHRQHAHVLPDSDHPPSGLHPDHHLLPLLCSGPCPLVLHVHIRCAILPSVCARGETS